jgi:hypothetical protein
MLGGAVHRAGIATLVKGVLTVGSSVADQAIIAN